MNVLRISNNEDNEHIANKAAAVLNNNGVVAHPTDTVYGLAANMFSEEAVKKIYNIKRRDELKAISVMVGSIDQIREVTGTISEFAENFIKLALPGAVTVILPIKNKLTNKYFSGRETIGFRIPEHEFCKKMLEQVNFPVTTTSANKSGLPDPQLAMEVLAHFGDSLDLLVDGGRTSLKKPSTIVEIINEKITVIREGSFDISTLNL